MAKRSLAILIVSLAMPMVWAAYRRELEQFGIDICGCQPAEIVFEINIAGTCDTSTVNSNSPGISSTDCTTTYFADDSGDRTPAYIEAVEVFEYMRNTSQADPFLSISERLDDGDSFSFASLLSTQEAIIDEMSVPNELFLSFLGYNSAGQEVYNEFQINFSNECGVHPVLAVGDAMGWVSIASVVESSVRVCPREIPTMHPTTYPTDLPTTGPSPSSSDSPTNRPTVDPTSKPTAEVPTQGPTDSAKPSPRTPTASPVEAPTGSAPTSSPSGPPSRSPSGLPMSSPTGTPMSLPNGSPTTAPAQSTLFDTAVGIVVWPFFTIWNILIFIIDSIASLFG